VNRAMASPNSGRFGSFSFTEAFARNQ